MLLKWWVRPLLLLTHWHFKFCVEGLHPSLNAERRWEKLKCKSSVLKSLLHIVLPSVSQCASPVFPASSSLHPAVALELPVRGIVGNDYVLPSVLRMRILVACLFIFFHPPFSLFPPFLLTCFFLRASSEVFWAAFSAAGLYTVFVRPTDVENTCKEK